MINNAKLQFDENGTPYSSEFDDIYFSRRDGVAETEYVFLKHNKIIPRFSSQIKTFHIAETGFGTGLNLLVTWSHLLEINNSRATPLKLTFTTFEKFPLSKSDLAAALKLWPQFESISLQLIEAYPDSLQTDNTLVLEDGLITLRLLIGDVTDCIRTLDLKNDHKVDAWYLDGFAPSKNPEMWNPVLFENMYKLSKPDCTLATFTAAGLVRRGLREAGFDVIKYKGFAFKREMVATRGVDDE